MSKTITLTVHQLDGRLLVYIPDHIVEETQIVAGQNITLKILTAPTDAPTLEQMLENYDPDKFGGEVMAYPLIGKEIIK